MIRLEFLAVCLWAFIGLVEAFVMAKSTASRLWTAVVVSAALSCAINVYHVLP